MHLTNSWHQNSGGIATFYRALVAEANRRGQLIRLVVPGAADRIEEAGEFGRIYHLQSPPAPFNGDYRVIYPSQFLFPESRLQQILAAERPDLVEISDKYTLNYLGALLRHRLLHGLDYRPVVVGLSQERMDDNFRAYLGSFPFARKFCSLYMRWLYLPFFDHHIANSEYTVSELLPAAQGQLVPRGTWIRSMGVDLTQLSPQRRSAEMRRRLLQNFGSQEESVLLLYAGRLAPEKNLPLLFDLLLHLARNGARDYQLLVAGDGIERRRWETWCAKAAPGRVLFLGHIKNQQVMADLYANADVFVHPNPREPFGIAPLEAMASGLPLVAPDTGGVASYANEENAWVVETTVTSFAAAVESAADRALGREKIANALMTARSYGWDSVAASFLDLYCDLCGQAERSPGGANPAAAQPVFYSSPAHGFQAALMHGLSQAAAASFRMGSALASHLGPRPGPAFSLVGDRPGTAPTTEPRAATRSAARSARARLLRRLTRQPASR
jgi:glycosyltransferase involved in cell wall biosynthesis